MIATSSQKRLAGSSCCMYFACSQTLKVASGPRCINRASRWRFDLTPSGFGSRLPYELRRSIRATIRSHWFRTGFAISCHVANTVLTNIAEGTMTFKVGSGLLAVSIFAFALTWAATASADVRNIRGSYGFTGTAACLVAPGHVGDPSGPPLSNPTPGVALANSGFQPNLRPNDAVPGSSTVAYSDSYAVEGIRKFNGTIRVPSRAQASELLSVRHQGRVDFRIFRRPQDHQTSVSLLPTRSTRTAAGPRQWCRVATPKTS
jgi:hypothetical protein